LHCATCDSHCGVLNLVISHSQIIFISTNLLGEVTGALWGVQDLVVEDGEVESQSEPNRVGWCQVHQSNVLQISQNSTGDYTLLYRQERMHKLAAHRIRCAELRGVTVMTTFPLIRTWAAL
jgi:hypothetical protein